MKVRDRHIPKIEKGMKKGIAFVAFLAVEEAETAKKEMDGLEVGRKRLGFSLCGRRGREMVETVKSHLLEKVRRWSLSPRTRIRMRAIRE